MTTATATVLTPTPPVLVVGFNVDQFLESRYKGSVLFQEDATSLKSPQEIPVGIAEIWVRSGVDERHKSRIENLTRAVRAVFNGSISSLPHLRDYLETKFPAPAPREAPVQSSRTEVDTTAADVALSTDLQKIRALKTTDGSTVDWVKCNMSFPCNPTQESEQLKILSLSQGLDYNKNTIYQSILSLVHRAGLNTKTSRVASTPRGDTVVGDMSELNVGRLLTELHEANQEFEVFSTRHRSKLLDLQMRIRGLMPQLSNASMLRDENTRHLAEITRLQEELKTTRTKLDRIGREFKG